MFWFFNIEVKSGDSLHFSENFLVLESNHISIDYSGNKLNW